jgi:SpoVK/Ycf46/Vps4 family AAA+-type ATPase
MQLNPKLDTYQNYRKLGDSALAAGDIARARQMFEQAAKTAEQISREAGTSDVKQFYADASKNLRDWLEATANSSQTIKVSNGGIDKAADTNSDSDSFSAKIPDVTLNDVAGLKEVQEQVRVNIIAPLDFPDIFYKFRKEAGARILLYGPPGTGKTLVAQAIAGTLKCPLAVVQSKDVLAKYVGEGEKNIGKFFEDANKYDRSIIFIDEIDALCADRESEDSRHTKGVLTTMLTLMDGFTSRSKPGQLKIIIAATNRPWILDSALKRGKRFDTLIYVGMPDTEAREWIIKKNLEKDVAVPRDDDVTIEWLAEKLDGFAGADISAICTKIINKPLGRALQRAIDKKPAQDERITRDDCTGIISKYINPITPEMLANYELYGKTD